MKHGPGGEGRGAEPAIGRGETVEVGKLVIGPVRYRFEAEEVQISSAGKSRHRGGFHVDKDGLMLGGEAALFLDARDVVERDESLAFGIRRGEDFSGSGVDHFADGGSCRGRESTGKRAGVTDGDEGVNDAGRDRAFAGAGDGGCAHARAGGDGVEVADAAGGHAFFVVPVTGERPELRGKGGDEGDAIHARLACGEVAWIDKSTLEHGAPKSPANIPVSLSSPAELAGAYRSGIAILRKIFQLPSGCFCHTVRYLSTTVVPPPKVASACPH